MAIRRVTGAVSPSELVFADANALGATYDGSGTTIERGETFTLPAGGTTAVSNGALRLEALKGDCTITNNGNSTLTNASGVDGTILMRSGATEFPAYVRNSSMSSMEVPARESFEGNITKSSGTFSGTIGSEATLPSGTVVQTDIIESPHWENFFNYWANDGWGETSMQIFFTPKRSDTHIIIMVKAEVSWYNTITKTYMRIVKDGSVISVGDAHGNRARVNSLIYLNTTSYATLPCHAIIKDNNVTAGTTVKYGVQIACSDDGGGVYLNRSHDWPNSANTATPTSSMFIQEIVS